MVLNATFFESNLFVFRHSFNWEKKIQKTKNLQMCSPAFNKGLDLQVLSDHFKKNS